MSFVTAQASHSNIRKRKNVSPPEGAQNEKGKLRTLIEPFTLCENSNIPTYAFERTQHCEGNGELAKDLTMTRQNE